MSIQLLGTTLRVPSHTIACHFTIVRILSVRGVMQEKVRTAHYKSSCPDVPMDVSGALSLPAWLPTVPDRPHSTSSHLPLQLQYLVQLDVLRLGFRL